MDAIDANLKEIYYKAEDSGSYGGVERLYQSAKNKGIRRDQVKDFLSRQHAYTLHKPARRHFTRNRTYV